MPAGDTGPSRPRPAADTDAVRAEKARLRREALARRAAREPEERRRAAAGLASGAVALARSLGAGVVAAYVGVGDEPDTLPMIDALRSTGAVVLLPVTVVDAVGRSLAWGRYEGADRLHRARYGLLEPAGDRLPHESVATADLALVPALLVDRTGTRLGRGGGYYDRALTGRRPPTFAVVHDDEVVATLPAEAHDVRVAGALTETGVLTWDVQVAQRLREGRTRGAGRDQEG